MSLYESLKGKHVLVTGASSGIGRETCVQLGKSGAKVSLVARDEERLKKTLDLMEGEGHRIYSFDLNRTDEIDSLTARITEDGGALDGLVHCAGVGGNRPLKLVKPACVEELMRIHLYAFAELIRTISVKKRLNDGGSLIGISSVASFHGEKTQGAYAAAKGAMNALVHSYAKELAVRRVRVNTIAFGMVKTEMHKDFIEAGGNETEVLQNQYLGLIPVSYAAEAICFMLSDSSKYMTGGALCYDGGYLS